MTRIPFDFQAAHEEASQRHAEAKFAEMLEMTDVRGNRHGADASQPGPAHPPGDSRHLEEDG